MLTDDATDPGLKRSEDTEPTDMADVYLVLDQHERQKGFVRPYRDTYRHTTCRQLTKMQIEIAQTFARDPLFYRGTYCTTCQMHRPLAEFTWEDGTVVGS